MSMKILFIVPYPHDTAPSQRLKFEQYYESFEKAGYEITTSSFIGRQFWQFIYKKGFYLKKAAYTLTGYLKRYALLASVSKYDIVYIHLWATPFGLPINEWLLRKLSKKIIYDIDDLIYKADSSPNNKFISFFKTSAKVNFLMKHADHVLVSTDKLLEYTRKLTTHVSLIPATIDVEKYKRVNVKKNDRIVIGWSGSHTTSKYLHLLDGVLKTLVDEYNVTISVMGDKNFEIPGLEVELVEWSAESEIENLKQFDIGLHPMPNEEWVYGKSGGKLVQYLAAGIPIVASAIGPNFVVIKEGYNGFLVNSNEEWIAKLKLLITNEALRKEMGKNSITCAEQLYSVEANLNKYLSVFNSK